MIESAHATRAQGLSEAVDRAIVLGGAGIPLA